MSFEIVRTPGGTFAPGHSGNPEGGRLTAKRRISHAMEDRIEDVCAQEIADKLVDGMKDPDTFPVAARIGFDRVWPVVKVDPGSDHGAPALASESQRLRFAELFDRELRDDQAGIIKVDAVRPDHEGD